MPVQIIESNRGGKIALHNGHSYNQKQSTNNCIHWRCKIYYKLKCPAILKTKNETVIETKGTHNHECDPGECKAKEVVNQIKRAEYSTPTVAIANEIYEISDDYAVQLAMPKKDNLLRAVSRKRQKAMCLQIPAPTDRHFDVPDEFAPFLLQDSGKDDKERILIFGDVTVKNLLNLSNTWLVDYGITDCRRILVVLRRVFGCSYGTWKRIRKCRSLNMFKKLPDYCAPSVPDTKK